MSLRRRFLHLVASDGGGSYSLRRIDMSRLFFARAATALDGGGGGAAGAVDLLAMPDDGPLPDPAMDFFFPSVPPGGGRQRSVKFMLFRNTSGYGHDNAVSVDNTGSTLVSDAGAPHASRRLPGLARPMDGVPLCLTVGDTLYAMDAFPNLKGGLQALRRGDGHWRDLPPHPLENARPDASHIIKSYAVAAAGDGRPRILVSSRGGQTYSFDTAARAWSKASDDWALPFTSLAEYVREHRLWFGLSLSDQLFCAANLAGGGWGGLGPPVIHGVWREEYAPPPAGWTLKQSHAVYLGASRFCVVRLFEVVSWHVGELYPILEAIHALFTGVEVERRGQALRVLRHRSERHRLDSSSHCWVLE